MNVLRSAFLALMVLSFFNADAQSRKKKNKEQNKISKPNIIFILADDLGIGNVSAYGADHYQTPNIDQLAKEGIRFNKTFTAPLCGPSRALILTGRYAYHTGATNQDATTALIKPELESMIPKVLKSAGYVSTCVGKWGQLPLGPAEFGFDDYLRFFKSGVYWNKGEKKMKYVENGVEKTLNDNEYMPDVMHNHLVDFIVANKEKPFFAYYPMSHVHAEIVATPDSKPDSKDLFADNILYMDKLVGKLVRTLDSLKLREKTMIVFMGDNGTSSEWVKNSTVNGKALSGKKGEMKECGGLVPMIVNWPSVVAPGVSSHQLIDASDFVPTLAAIAGAEMPKNINYDGQSFAAQLTGSKGTERDWIFVELGKHWYVRDSLWKLNEEGQLFDMSNAPFEEKLITPELSTASSETAKKKLQTVLDQLSPQTGIVDTGNGDGRHANKKNKKEKAGGEKAKEEGE